MKVVVVPSPLCWVSSLWHWASVKQSSYWWVSLTTFGSQLLPFPAWNKLRKLCANSRQLNVVLVETTQVGILPLSMHWLEKVYQENRERLFRLAWIHVRESSAAEDVVHDAMVKLAAQDKPRNPAAFAMTVVRNTAIDSRRRSRKLQSVDEWQIQREASYDARTEDHFWIEELLRQLTPAAREVVELKLRLDMTFQEIADLTAQPLSTVCSRYRRAIEQLQAENEAHDDRS